MGCVSARGTWNFRTENTSTFRSTIRTGGAQGTDVRGVRRETNFWGRGTDSGLPSCFPNVGWCAPQPPTPHPSDEQTLAPSGAGVFFFAEAIENARLREKQRRPNLSECVAGNRAAGLAWASGLADLPRRQTRCFPLNSLYHNIVITRVQKSAAPTDALRLREVLRCHRLGGHYAALGVRGASLIRHQHDALTAATARPQPSPILPNGYGRSRP